MTEVCLFQDLVGTAMIELNRDSILSKFIRNTSLTDLTLDVSESTMAELKLYLERNEKKHRSQGSIAFANQALTSPKFTTLRNKSSTLKLNVLDVQEPPQSPSPRYLFIAQIGMSAASLP